MRVNEGPTSPVLAEAQDDHLALVEGGSRFGGATAAGGVAERQVSGWTEGLPASIPPVLMAGGRIAIVHEWLETFAGSEAVLEQLLLVFPSADVFAVVDFMREKDRRFLQGRKIKTTFIQRLPLARRMFRNYLGLMPIAIQQLDLSGYDLVISSSHAVAKGVITGPDQIHISYVHSPMRYIWDLQHQYLTHAGLKRGVKALYVRWLFGRLREWDVATANNVDHFVANSTYIARRIRKTYRREAYVIHPPVDTEYFVPGECKENFFLLVSRFVPYKRADLIVESFARQTDRRLVVVGAGPQEADVRAAAQNAPNIEFQGAVSRSDLVSLMQRARAVVFAAEEDFGITMVEAQACGTPIIAFNRGGVGDILPSDDAEQPTGVLFHRQDPEAVIAALQTFDRIEGLITGEACRQNAMRFSQSRFRSEISGFVSSVIA
jgi:glycosyltransferase involved in cell wall biosynthesis